MADARYHSESGRFRKGNPGGRGNANAKAAGEARAQLFTTIDPEKRRKLWLKIWRMAMKGSAPHAKIITDQLCGKAPVAVEVTHEGSALQISLADIQLAIVEAVGIGSPQAQKVATAFRQLAHKESHNGSDA